MSEKQTTPKELLSEAYGLLTEKKTASKHMNMVAADMAKMQKIEKPVMIRCKDYSYYHKRGWMGNPLELDPNEKFKDRVSPTFKKLLQIIDDLYATGNPDLLEPYFEAMAAHGIEIKVKNKDVRVNDIDETWAAIDNMKGFQATICELADEINFGCTQVAEDINFSPKAEFKGALNLYAKVTEEKDVDDIYQTKITNLNMTETAYNDIYDDNLK